MTQINHGEDILLELAGIWYPLPRESGRQDWFMDIHRDFFSRISSGSPPVRFIRYSLSGKNGFSGFALLIVHRSQSPLSDGMTRWILTNQRLVMVSDTGAWRSHRVVHTRAPSPGEIPVSLILENPPEEEGVLTASAWLCPGDHERDKVVLVPYDRSWPVLALAGIEWFTGQVGSGFVGRAEHYGSTAIPGMIAKPVIDLLIEVPSSGEAVEKIIPLMNDTSCEFWWYKDHIAMIVRDPKTRIRKYHIHLAPAGHEIWQGLVFRDRLREDPDAASAYARLKDNLCSRFGDEREEYTRAKGDFVREILSLR